MSTSRKLRCMSSSPCHVMHSNRSSLVANKMCSPNVVALSTCVTILVESDRRANANGMVGAVNGMTMLAKDETIRPGTSVESLSKLQASGLVQTRHGIGTFVIENPNAGNFRIAAADFATVADVISVLELRISLETEAAGLAAQRRSGDNLATMAAALRNFQDSIRVDSDAVPSDFQFHMEVARATGNRHFTDLMTYLGTMIIPRTRVNTPQADPEGRLSYLQRVHGEHESIYNAILNQDADAARAAMRTHLSNSRERLRKNL